MKTVCEVSEAIPSKKVTESPKTNFAVSDVKTDTLKLDEKTDTQLIGQDYIEEIKNDEGKVVTFQCKLCECRFNDPNAKEIHLKGKRHRLRYKKKVDPELVVDFKQNLRQKKAHEEKLRRQQIREELFRHYEEERWRGEMRLMEEEERLRRRFEEELKCFDWQRRLHLDLQSSLPPPPLPPRSLLGGLPASSMISTVVVAPEDSYEVKLCVEEAAVTVLAEQNVTVTVTLTSPVMRKSGDDGASAENVKDPPDVLDRQKCLDALAALRHAKWFQAKASGLHSCVVVIRILQDLRRRLPTWGRLSSWAMELLVEKVLSSSQLPLSSGDALRRVFEAVSGGILLPGGPGLMDPCEKDAVDVADLNNQDREDLAASAQQALRLMVFRQVHKVLGMDPLPLPKFVRGRFNRKRRHNSTGEESKQEGVEGKKVKKTVTKYSLKRWQKQLYKNEKMKFIHEIVLVSYCTYQIRH
ncbi:zinc finger RNA-binding protein-like [Limulus polyphemus]|uniref:Zinc finger RNA-binding protein-like n=1 Tax=Limulus polyphemus TaxID=6850 RepID=A0ABM1T3X5_LIMPO|nr:zinc finger RNA-binding protein-like [Limulus polyphemus]